ncbi:tunicamycin resistance protein [Filobacillus milosensis]|uniref:Tunicamycin resistance protein n=1 Tax=Filobacillus milosensis TaxID=94137 RepID=A0A4Y8IGA6_9BACI|nr:AAA family ATPase [Filobacillus milosensis]TFB19551.1 tunicamycin resistance protein [Filobacillus milosensis]
MIIMINGAFGVGKTTVANELVKELDNSMIYDPEEVGFMLREVIPDEMKWAEAETGDFQDLELWRELTVTVAESLHKKYNKTLIVPMTIRRPEYFNYIINGFKNIDRTYPFCLTASKEVIHNRLRKREAEEDGWCFQQTDKCLKAYNEHDFSEYVNTEGMSVKEVIESIKKQLK